MQIRTLSLNGEPFAYLEHGGGGDGPCALFIHGFPDTPRSFQPLMRSMAQIGYRCVAPYARGYSPSTLRGPFDPLTIARDVVDLSNALSPHHPVVLVGHDWGAVASHLAMASAPDRFSAGVTMSVPHPLAFLRQSWRNPKQLARSWYMAFLSLPWLPERIVPRGDYRWIDDLWKSWSPGYTLPDTERHLLHHCLEESMPAPLEYYRAIFRPSLRFLRAMKGALEEGGLISTPTLYLHGGDDGCIGFDVAKGQEAYFTGRFEAHVLSGVGHFLHLEDPDRVAARIVAFL